MSAPRRPIASRPTSTTPRAGTSGSPSASPTPRATAASRRASRTTPTPTSTSSTARRDGVVIRGAKLHITGASLGHDLMTIPTKAMKPGEEDYAIAVMVPVNAPGVKIVNTTFAPRHPDTRTFPVSAPHSPARGLRDLRRRVRAERADPARRRSPPRPPCSPTPSVCGSASAASPAWPTTPTGWSASPSSSPRPTALAGVGARQGEDLRDDDPRHPDPGLARGGDQPRPDRGQRGAFPDELLHQRRQVPRRRQLRQHDPRPPRHRRRRRRHRARHRRLREPRHRRPRAQVHGHRPGVDGEYRRPRSSTPSATSPPTPTADGGFTPTSRPAAGCTPSASSPAASTTSTGPRSGPSSRSGCAPTAS